MRVPVILIKGDQFERLTSLLAQSSADLEAACVQLAKLLIETLPKALTPEEAREFALRLRQAVAGSPIEAEVDMFTDAPYVMEPIWAEFKQFVPEPRDAPDDFPNWYDFPVIKGRAGVKPRYLSRAVRRLLPRPPP